MDELDALTTRDLDLIEVALDSAMMTCQSFGSEKVDPLGLEYRHAQQAVERLRKALER